MKDRIRNNGMLMLCICILINCTACGSASYETYVLKPNEELLAENEYYSPDSSVSQLTKEDIQKMNNGQAQMIFNQEGYLTFLEGKYYDKQITGYEDAVASLNGVATLLGLGAGCEFFANFGEKDEDGYTYYVFQQRYGDATVQFATLRVIVGPDGYTAGVSSSFTPNIGIADITDSITTENAVQITKDFFANSGIELTYYPESTAKVAVTFNNINYNCYAVYTNNPYMTQNFDMPYVEHFVTYEGEYLYNLAVGSLSTDNLDAFKTAKYFEGLETETYSGDVTFNDGSTRHIEIPIAYNPKDGLYYLADVERKIIVTDYYAFVYQSEWLDFITSTDGKTWNNMDLITYSNYITAYDFYSNRGIDAPDGFGVPMLLCVNYCDANKNPVENCCYFGINHGFACFAAPTDFNLSEGLDVICHEYTHGITTNSMCGNYYVNACGAINESYSDIMGNIIEMMTGYTDDTTWLLGEKTGNPIRSMSSPHDFNQPESTSDSYYYPPTDKPDSAQNDNGGVHINSSLLNMVAYTLWANGMALEDEASLWITSIELITPLSGYQEIYAALLMSVDINNLNQVYKNQITDAFRSAGLLE